MKLNETDIRPDELIEEQKRRFNIDISNIKKRLKEFCSVNCPACDSNDYIFKFKKFGFTYVECKNCNTMYMNPRPSPEIINWYYSNSENYKFWNTHIFPASEKNRVNLIIKPRIKKIIEISKKFKIDKELFLEIGPGFGSFGQELKKHNFFKKFIAVEPMPDLAESCRKKGLQVIERPVEKIKSLDKKASVVASFEVIEHLFSPAIFLSGIKKLIKKNGLLFITCPNYNGFEISTLGKNSDTIDIEHLNYFTIRSLSILLKKIGFKVIDAFTPGLLDADIVRKKIINGKLKIQKEHFLYKILIDDWDNSGKSFQDFIIKNNLSTHMWIVAIND